MKKDFLVLTCTLGGKDKLTDPSIVFDSCDYIAIVDQPYDTTVWNLYSYYNFSSIDNFTHRRNAKLYKVLSTILFPDYKYIIWHDGNYELNVDPKDIIEKYGEHDFYTIQHPIRNCSYEEMQVIANSGRDNPKLVESQYNYYNQQNFPKQFGLYAMGNSIKCVNVKITTLELKWWEHITKYSSRDQCSFMYCVWDMQRNNMPINIKNLGILDKNIYFKSKGTRLI